MATLPCSPPSTPASPPRSAPSDATTALASRNFERIIGLVGPSPALTALAVPARIAFLASLKRSHPTFYAQTGDHVATRHIYEFLAG